MSHLVECSDSGSDSDSDEGVIFTSPASECGTDDTGDFPSVYEQPSGFERWFYYDAFPTAPHLIGRTSCWSTPWVHNVHGDLPDRSPQLREFRQRLRRLTRVAPVGQHHPIHRMWASSTGPKILQALSTLRWTSVDVLRMSVPTELDAALPPNQWPVIVWIALGHRYEAGLTGHHSYRHQWLVIDNLLQRVRRILDADGLQDVECEIREAYVADTDKESQEPGPEPGEPGPEPSQEPSPEPSPEPHVRSLSPRQDGWELNVAAPLLACPGMLIRHDLAGPDGWGVAITLGLYVAPDVETEASPSSSDPSTDQTIWALTCGQSIEISKGLITTWDDQRTTAIRAPTMRSLRTAYSRAGFRNHDAVMEKICAEPSDKRDYQLRILRMIEGFKKMGRCRRTLGQVRRENAPPAGVVRVAETASSAALSSSSSSSFVPPPTPASTFTRDWALIDVNRDYVDPVSTFNVLPMALTTPKLKATQRLARKVLQDPTFAFHPNGNVRLRPGRGPDAIIPLDEQFGPNNPPIKLVAKRGGRSGCTLGVPLDIGSYVRDEIDPDVDDITHTPVSVEWAMVHACATINRGHKSRISAFCMEADSGSAVFDMNGRVGGILTTGSYGFGFKGRFDISYATPMEHVLRDIEETVGTKVKII